MGGKQDKKICYSSKDRVRVTFDENTTPQNYAVAKYGYEIYSRICTS